MTIPDKVSLKHILQSRLAAHQYNDGLVEDCARYISALTDDQPDLDGLGLIDDYIEESEHQGMIAPREIPEGQELQGCDAPGCMDWRLVSDDDSLERLLYDEGYIVVMQGNGELHFCCPEHLVQYYQETPDPKVSDNANG